MTYDLDFFGSDIYSSVAIVALVFIRISAAFFFLPGFGESMIPMRVRLAIAFVFSFLVALVVSNQPNHSEFSESIEGSLILSEVLLGLIIGISARIIYIGLQIAGVIAAQSTSLSQLLGGEAVDPQPALSALLILGGLALAMLLGLGEIIVKMFADLYITLPIGTLLTSDFGVAWFSGALAATFEFSLSLAAPFVLLSLLYNVGLGIINKAMPQLMVAFVGAPAITFSTILIFVFSGPIILKLWHTTFILTLENPFGHYK